MATFLLELRTEEIPANALPQARTQLARGLTEVLEQAGFEGFSVQPLSTSRRLAVQVHQLELTQEDRQERVLGPPKRVGFDGDGAPTKAAEGFARKVGVAVDEIELESTDKGEYLAATVLHRGLSTAQILSQAIPDVIAAMRFPKTMRWGDGTFTFVRPMHGVVAVLDGETLPVKLFGIAATAATTGHRVHAPEAITVTAKGYQENLAEHSVLVDPEIRRRMLEEQAAALASEVGCRVHADSSLVAEHVELVEYPGLLRGSIQPQYLELPREVVITTLAYHQKCLVLECENGELAPYFLSVVDRRDDPRGLVQQGNEWVIGARLADARFFFDEDRKRPLERLVEGLHRLEFHRQLGSLADKARRAGTLAEHLAQQLGEEIATAELQRVAHLVKADLLTNMVGEFPSLQGIMGGHYLRLEGEPEQVYSAARDHYQPQGFEGELPTSMMGKLLGVADRLDTVAALCAVGEVPSGSKDPFGLRRAAQAVVKIVAESSWSISLPRAIDAALELVRDNATADLEQVNEQVRSFFADRVRRYLVDFNDVAGDTADAVMAASWDDLPELVARAAALEAVRTHREFRSLALAFKRVRNITQGQHNHSVDAGTLEEPAEQELYAKAQEFHTTLARLLGQRKLVDAFAAMGALADVLERFFTEVLVMTDDEVLRCNRIALLQQLGRDFLLLADLARLQVEGGS